MNMASGVRGRRDRDEDWCEEDYYDKSRGVILKTGIRRLEFQPSHLRNTSVFKFLPTTIRAIRPAHHPAGPFPTS
jgi:hypothetical protein